MTERAVPGPESLAFPRQYARYCLLLLIGERPSHGYDLLERLVRLGLAEIDPGGLYRALRMLEREGAVRSRWETSPSGPARRVYRLTAAGRDSLHVAATGVREARDLLSQYLERYHALADAPASGRAQEAPNLDARDRSRPSPRPDTSEKRGSPSVIAGDP